MKYYRIWPFLLYTKFSNTQTCNTTYSIFSNPIYLKPSTFKPKPWSPNFKPYTPNQTNPHKCYKNPAKTPTTTLQTSYSNPTKAYKILQKTYKILQTTTQNQDEDTPQQLRPPLRGEPRLHGRRLRNTTLGLGV